MDVFHSSTAYIVFLTVTDNYTVAADTVRSVEIRGPEVILTFKDSNSMRIPKKDVLVSFLEEMGLR